MIGQMHTNKDNLVAFSCLAVAVLLLFQISALSESLSTDEQPTDGLDLLDGSDPVDKLVNTEQEVKAPSTPHKALTVYQVQPGDSLYWIAATYGLTVEELKELNRLDSDVIRVGQRLVVPLEQVKYYPVGVHLTAQEVEWLAQMIHAEARGEPYLGQVAVGAVIINRLRSSEFPNTLRGVLFQRNAFQPIQNGSFYQKPNESARRAALEALNGHDPTGGALYFFNPRLSNDRFMHSRPAKVTIGSHRFMM